VLLLVVLEIGTIGEGYKLKLVIFGRHNILLWLESGPFQSYLGVEYKCYGRRKRRSKTA
jgi:hypothetical protein